MTQHGNRIYYGLFVAALALGAGCRAPTTVIGDDSTVYVSTSDGPIHVYALDRQLGRLAETSQIAGGVNPSYMAFSPDKRFAFAVNEADAADSKALSFSVDRSDGRLTAISSTATGANGAPHLAVHPSGRWLGVAHYGGDADEWTGGQTVVIPIARDGTLGQAGPLNLGVPDHPCVNAHQVVFTRRGDYALVPCLGSDAVISYRFERGTLALNEPAEVRLPSESGPRHLAFSPDQRHAYLLTEISEKVVWFDFDASTGRLEEVGQAQATKAPPVEGRRGWSGHILVHPSGKYLYVSNRSEGAEHGTENSLGVFALDADGAPTPLLDAFVTQDVDTPRDFAIDPQGEYLISANQNGDHSVLVFRIDPDTGSLTRTQLLQLEEPPVFVHVL